MTKRLLLIAAQIVVLDQFAHFPSSNEIVSHALADTEKPFTSGSWTVSFKLEDEIVGDCSTGTWIVSIKGKNGWEYASFLDMSNGCSDGFRIHLSNVQVIKCPENDDGCKVLKRMGDVHELRRKADRR